MCWQKGTRAEILTTYEKIELIWLLFPPPPPFFSSRKGLSKGDADRCFQGKSEDGLPAPFTKSVQEAIDKYTLYVFMSDII